MYTLVTNALIDMTHDFIHHLAESKHDLILCDSQVDTLNKTASELQKSYSIDVKVIAQDFCDVAAAEALYAKCLEQGLEIDQLINFPYVDNIDDIKSMESLMICNMLTLTKLCYLFLPQLQKNKGTLLNVALKDNKVAPQFRAAYEATKAYVSSLTYSLQNELIANRS